MLVLCCNIEIGKYRFESVHEVTIQSSWKILGDTATIKLPNYKQEKLEQIIQIGDPVKIQLGYNNKLQTEFIGYVAERLPNAPFEIKCEDPMFLLKRKALDNETLKKPTLEVIVKHIIDGVSGNLNNGKIELLNSDAIARKMIVPQYRFEYVTSALALMDLKEKYGLTIYLRGNALFVGKTYTDSTVANEKPVIYHLQENVVDTNLTYKNKQDKAIMVKAVSIQEDNTVIVAEAEGSDSAGEPYILRYYNIDDQTALKEIATEKFKKLTYEGYQGSITTFGIPFIQHGHKAKILDKEYPNREGTYFIDQVDTYFGTNGYRRTVTLGEKVI